jgi:hypothetical protein
MLIFASDVWVTIDINHLQISYLSLTVYVGGTFQVGPGSIKMYTICTTYSTELFYLINLLGAACISMHIMAAH